MWISCLFTLHHITRGWAPCNDCTYTFIRFVDTTDRARSSDAVHFQTWMPAYETTRRHTPEDCNIKTANTTVGARDFFCCPPERLWNPFCYRPDMMLIEACSTHGGTECEIRDGTTWETRVVVGMILTLTSWFQTFAVFWMLRVIFNSRRFGTLHIHSPMKMEQTQCSETSAIKHHTPGNDPKDYTQ
jgi:hypothetical protein